MNDHIFLCLLSFFQLSETLRYESLQQQRDVRTDHWLAN